MAEALYLDVVRPLNVSYTDLLAAFNRMDTRVFYLRSFASALSMAMPKDLWSNEQYVEQLERNPLPEDIYSTLDYDTFQSWITVYEMIMRSVGLIGQSRSQSNSYLSKYFRGVEEDGD
mgnify:FL=1